MERRSSRLDLHGVKHQDVDMIVENFILLNQGSFPLTIICGNSVKMVDLVNATIDRIGCIREMYRFGIITVARFT
jgi:hypothetical protein